MADFNDPYSTPQSKERARMLRLEAGIERPGYGRTPDPTRRSDGVSPGPVSPVDPWGSGFFKTNAQRAEIERNRLGYNGVSSPNPGFSIKGPEMSISDIARVYGDPYSMTQGTADILSAWRNGEHGQGLPSVNRTATPIQSPVNRTAVPVSPSPVAPPMKANETIPGLIQPAKPFNPENTLAYDFGSTMRTVADMGANAALNAPSLFNQQMVSGPAQVIGTGLAVGRAAENTISDMARGFTLSPYDNPPKRTKAANAAQDILAAYRNNKVASR